VLKSCNFITLHVPLVDATRKMINATSIEQMKHGAVLLNFSREGRGRRGGGARRAGCEEAGLLRLRFSQSPCQCPSARYRLAPPRRLDARGGGKLRDHGRRSGARLHARRQRRQFGEFPECRYAARIKLPLAIANANVPNMLGQISTAMAEAKLNIHNMMNKSKKDVAYTLVDVDSKVPKKVIDQIAKIEGVLAVRYLPREA
jgi:D-3-phosphoglycerate dehydrogenase